MAGNSPTRRSGRFRVESEVDVLRNSVVVILVVSALGVGLGLFSNSFAILFEGTFSLIDASMTIVALMVARLIARARSGELADTRLAARFTMGFWHLEPLVLTVNGLLLTGAASFALVGAVASLMSGGRAVVLGPALAYSVATALICFAMVAVESRANRRLQSDMIRLDIQGWWLSGLIAVALLVSFGGSLLLARTQAAWLIPYIDPAALAIICLCVLPMPVKVVYQALKDVLLVTPSELRREVEHVAATIVHEHGFVGYRAHVAKVGRAIQVELAFQVPGGHPPLPVEHWDGIRDAIDERIAAADGDRWLTITFSTRP